MVAQNESIVISFTFADESVMNQSIVEDVLVLPFGQHAPLTRPNYFTVGRFQISSSLELRRRWMSGWRVPHARC